MTPRRRSIPHRSLCAAIAAAFIVAGCSGGKHVTTSTTRTNVIPRPVARIRLTSPTGKPSLVGVGEIVRRGNNEAIAILGKGLPRNTRHDAYAVWLYNSPTDAVRLGFVNPGVGKNGHLDTAGGLPANATHYRRLLITLETTADPARPGSIVLEGPFAAG